MISSRSPLRTGKFVSKTACPRSEERNEPCNREGNDHPRRSCFAASSCNLRLNDEGVRTPLATAGWQTRRGDFVLLFSSRRLTLATTRRGESIDAGPLIQRDCRPSFQPSSRAHAPLCLPRVCKHFPPLYHRGIDGDSSNDKYLESTRTAPSRRRMRA